MCEALKILDGLAGPTVLWIDDRVLFTREQLSAIQNNGGSADSVSMWAMDRDWLDCISGATPEDHLDQYDQDKDFYRSGIIIIGECRKRNFNLMALSFREAHKFLVGKDILSFLFLLDLEDATKALGYNEVGGNVIDENWNWSAYGAHFVSHYGIDRSKFRFCTRFRRMSDHQDWIVDACPNLFNADADALAHCVPVSSCESIATEEKLRSFLNSNLVSPSPDVNSGIFFACRPRHTHWTHDCLGAVNKNPNQNEMIRSWLDLDSLSPQSAKGLFRSVACDETRIKPDWSVVRTTMADKYSIDLAAVVATFMKLGVPIESDLEVSCCVILPITPGFPFLLAVAALYWELENDADFFPPESVRLSFRSSEKTWRIEITLKKTDQHGDSVSFEKFSNAWESRSGHQTIARMRDVAKSAVDVNSEDLASVLSPEVVAGNIDVKPFFSGLAEEIVLIRINSPSIIIEWTIK